MSCIKKITTSFLVILLCFFNIFTVFASNQFEIKCTIENVDRTKISIDIYDLSEIDESIIQIGAKNTFDYIIKNNILPAFSGNFNSNGIYKINDLKNNLWLIKSGDFIKNGTKYKAIPQIIDSSKIGSFEIVEPKYEFDVPDDTSVTYIVQKKWVDSKDTIHNPISVSILHNDIVYDTITLSSENNWIYKWNYLSPDGKWRVTENNVPNGYTVSYDKSDNTFIITNTSTTVFHPQTGLGSIFESINNRVIIIMSCIFISTTTLIIAIKTKNKHK